MSRVSIPSFSRTMKWYHIKRFVNNGSILTLAMNFVLYTDIHITHNHGYAFLCACKNKHHLAVV